MKTLFVWEGHIIARMTAAEEAAEHTVPTEDRS